MLFSVLIRLFYRLYRFFQNAFSFFERLPMVILVRVGNFHPQIRKRRFKHFFESIALFFGEVKINHIILVYLVNDDL